MQPKGSLLCSQKPTTFPCPDPDESQPHSPNLFLHGTFYIILLSTSRSSKCSISCRFPNQNLTLISLLPHVLHLLCPPHSPWLITLIFGDEYKLWSSSVCNFLQSSVTRRRMAMKIGAFQAQKTYVTCSNKIHWGLRLLLVPSVCTQRSSQSIRADAETHTRTPARWDHSQLPSATYGSDIPFWRTHHLQELSCAGK